MEPLAAAYLTHVGYYRLSAYLYPLLELPKEDHIYKSTASFGKVVEMYTSDILDPRAQRSPQPLLPP